MYSKSPNESTTKLIATCKLKDREHLPKPMALLLESSSKAPLSPTGSKTAELVLYSKFMTVKPCLLH